MTNDFDPDQLPNPWLLLDPQGRLLRHNRAFAQLVGWGATPPAAPPLFDRLLTGASRMLFQSYLQPLLRLHGHVQELSLTLLAAQGETVDVLFYSEPLATAAEAGRAPPLSVSLVPIRRRRDIEARMLRIKRAADASPGLIFQLLLQPDGRVQFSYLSEAVRRLYGVSPEAAMASADAVLGRLLPDDQVALMGALHAAAAINRDCDVAFRVALPDSPVRWHELHATPHRLADDLCLWHGHIADVTERRALQQALTDRESRERLTLLRGDFLGRISHELRTPLNGLLGFLQLMGRDAAHPLPPEQAHRLDVAVQAGQHLLQLVNQVLDVSRLDHAEPEAPLGPVALPGAVRQALTLVMGLAAAQRVTLEPLALPPLQVQANELRLRQVLLNLLSNAVKYNRPGGRVRVQAVVSEADGTVALSIGDDGPGLSPEQQAALFQPYQRLGAEQGPTEGSGLGLVVTRHLLQLMNGRLQLHSQPGGGSVFTVELPLARAGAPTHLPAAASASPTSGPAAAAAAPVPAAAQGTVLCVEDNPVSQQLLEAVLGLRPGLRVCMTASGAEALAAAARTPPDLMLLDLQLPDTNGARLLADLRRAGVPNAVPAVLISADAHEENVEAARGAGFIDCWPKPLDVQRALSELDRLLAPRA